MKAPVRKIRCAVYTRVSTDERLDMEFNSLDAQREAALSYIASRSMKAGFPSATATTTAVSPAARWSVRRCSGCCTMSNAASST